MSGSSCRHTYPLRSTSYPTLTDGIFKLFGTGLTTVKIMTKIVQIYRSTVEITQKSKNLQQKIIIRTKVQMNQGSSV